MLGVSGLIDNSVDGAAAAAEARESGGASGGGGGAVGGLETITGGFSEEEKTRIEEGERNSGGNRWPRQETLALLKIRSDMDVVFRDSSLKGPLWEEVSRKMSELGYHRSSKKCKEKFENVYKYHRRTKEGRASKPDGKTYRFFDQLEALENHPPHPLPPPPPRPQAPLMAATTMTVAMPGSSEPPIVSQLTVPSTINPIPISQNSVTLNVNPISSSLPPSQPPPQMNTATNAANLSHSAASLMFYSTSSSTSSDEQPERRGKRKREWKDFFERLMKEVIQKQEDLQKKFIEMLEKRERDRMIREEAWRVQEMARMNREHELLVQERSLAAAKDAAVMAFLQKVTEQQNPQNPNAVPQFQMHIQLPENTLPTPPPPRPSLQQTPPPPPPTQQSPLPAPPPPTQQTSLALAVKNVDTVKTDNGGDNFTPASSSRWPKAEVEALIKLRTNLDLRYQENGPKGPLWEEISAAMRKVGYNRNSKRCKEKWENINKYFKKVKESNKKRPEDAKTCPYFHQLDALYKEKAKTDGSFNPGSFSMNKPENPMVPIMVQPEQQWPLPQQTNQPDSVMEDQNSENFDQNDHEDEEGEDDDEEEDGGGYEIVTNRPSSMATTVE
ncbi:unnamed protein product [Ilex paraguariensis]|uniref:Myb-like domain-containing protein n=1 Tax=Ilex paraguariensis TaxID=185542 RepID=A0ABC8QPS2_9AQUA